MKQAISISVIVLTLLLGVFTTVQIYDSVQVNKIISQKDTSLVAYDYAKTLSEDALKLLTINNQADYTSARNKYKKILSDEMWHDYFSSEEYQGGDKNLSIKRTGIVGSLEGGNHFVFKLSFTLTSGSQEKNSAILVYVKNNIIYKTQSLG